MLSNLYIGRNHHANFYCTFALTPAHFAALVGGNYKLLFGAPPVPGVAAFGPIPALTAPPLLAPVRLDPRLLILNAAGAVIGIRCSVGVTSEGTCQYGGQLTPAPPPVIALGAAAAGAFAFTRS